LKVEVFHLAVHFVYQMILLVGVSYTPLDIDHQETMLQSINATGVHNQMR
jgi:hypothetical protein